MTQKEFNSLTFSQRHEISKGKKCNASWQVRTIGGSAAYAISCRECGTVLQSDCTPKCLININQPTGINLPVRQAEGSDGAQGAAVGQRSVGTVAVRELSKHVCGAQGHNPMLGDICEGCENERSSRDGQP